MNLTLPANSRLRKILGESGVDFLQHGLGGLTRLLPHMEAGRWTIEPKSSKTVAQFRDANKRQLRLDLGLTLGSTDWKIGGVLQRRTAPSGVGVIPRTISERERDIAGRVLNLLARTLGPAPSGAASSLPSLRPSFDERVVAEHLAHHHGLKSDLSEWLAELRRLAEQTYENKALAFGCVIKASKRVKAAQGVRFPQDFLKRKKYRALSDAYRTAYLVSGGGRLLGFLELGLSKASGPHFYPAWCEDLATHARAGKIALALTRQGDILVLDEGHLSFTYRFGRWQFWNHTHLVDVISNAARVQKVPPKLLAKVVRSVYRAALDVSFRRSGGLFVLLKRRKSLHEIVRRGEAVGDSGRDPMDATFDQSVAKQRVQSLSRPVLAELASLDGAVVFANNGALLAYGAILEPTRKGRITGTEGSRSKAAIGSSHYGLSIKVSSDGDIRVYLNGKELLAV